MKVFVLTIASLGMLMNPSQLLANQEGETVSSDGVEPSVMRELALAEWDKVYEVFSHPRCANCHVPADNRPRWSGPSYGLTESEWVYHGINIDGGVTRDGQNSIPCASCHASSNSELPHGPPGAPHWALAPVEMVWWEKSSREICEQIKDPERTGGRNLEEVAHHIGHDALVLWGWDPGPGREVPPSSNSQTVASFEAWVDAGAPCPSDG